MKQTLLIVMLCLMSGQVCCSRNKSSHQTGANTSTRASNGVAEDRAQARFYLDTGKERYRTDQDEQAASAFAQAIQLDPDLAEAHFRLGLAYTALGKAQEAETEYKKAVETYRKYLEDNPKDTEAHYYLGQTYSGLHLYSEAVREYRQAVRLTSNDAEIYYDLGSALTRLAQYDEASAAFSKSLEIDPENYRAEDALDEAREGSKRIRAGKKHQEELLKKEREDELKKGDGGLPKSSASPLSRTSKPAPGHKP
jgi:tetratricopeptide (TPR) repeat protein